MNRKRELIYLPRRWPSLPQMHQCHLCDIGVVYIIGQSGGMVWGITVREVSYPGEEHLSLDMTLSARLFPIPYRRWAQQRIYHTTKSILFIYLMLFVHCFKLLSLNLAKRNFFWWVFHSQYMHTPNGKMVLPLPSPSWTKLCDATTAARMATANMSTKQRQENISFTGDYFWEN